LQKRRQGFIEQAELKQLKEKKSTAIEKVYKVESKMEDKPPRMDQSSYVLRFSGSIRINKNQIIHAVSMRFIFFKQKTKKKPKKTKKNQKTKKKPKKFEKICKKKDKNTGFIDRRTIGRNGSWSVDRQQLSTCAFFLTGT
jgi:hypothetical protein